MCVWGGTVEQRIEERTLAVVELAEKLLRRHRLGCHVAFGLWIDLPAREVDLIVAQVKYPIRKGVDDVTENLSEHFVRQVGGRVKLAAGWLGAKLRVVYLKPLKVGRNQAESTPISTDGQRDVGLIPKIIPQKATRHGAVVTALIGVSDERAGQIDVGQIDVEVIVPPERSRRS